MEEKLRTYPTITAVSKEELEEYPICSFEGPIHVIDNRKDVEKAARFLSQKTILGFDTETRPSFTKNKTNGVALLQLSDENEAFLFQLKKTGLPDSLAAILSNSNIGKVGVAVRDDIRILQKLNPFQAENFIELQTIAKQLQIDALGLRKLTPIALGFRISKRQQLSNWENPVLTEAQQRYAATDAWVSLKIYQQLHPYIV